MSEPKQPPKIEPELTPEGADGASISPFQDESDWHEHVYEKHVAADNPELAEAMKKLRKQLG